MIKHIYKIIVVNIIIFISACAQLPTDFEAKPSHVLTNTENTILGKKSILELESSELSKMYLIDDGVDAFVIRAALLSLAEKSIDAQYYIWRADLIGKLLFNAMLTAADRGVRVRILLDDMPVDKEVESILYTLDQHENIEVRLFNPFASREFRSVTFLISPKRINRRMHNKSFSVDSQYTVIGGRNIGDEYFSAHIESNFEDIDVLATGAVVDDIGKQFDEYWNSKVVYPVNVFDHNTATENDLQSLRVSFNEFKKSKDNSKYHLDVKDSKAYKRLAEGSVRINDDWNVFKGEVEVVYDNPEKGLGKSEDEIIYLKSLVEPYIEKMENSFEIISPYFVPGRDGVSFLAELVKKGIKVRVVTNSLSSTDGLMAQSGYSRRRYALLESGIELYEMKTDLKSVMSKSLRRGEKAKSSLHAKTYIFDRKQLFIGSFNFDNRSANINSEVGVIYKVPKMARLIAEDVFDDSLSTTVYKVKIADRDIDEGGVQIDKGDLYWVEMKDNKKIYYDTEPKTGFWRRFGQGLFSIMPIESQL